MFFLPFVVTIDRILHGVFVEPFSTLESVTDSPDTDEVPRPGWVRFDLFPQMNDVGIEGPRRDDGVSPGLIEKVVPPHHFPLSFYKEFQKPEFQSREMNRFPGFKDLMASEIDRNIAEREDIPCLFVFSRPMLSIFSRFFAARCLLSGVR